MQSSPWRWAGQMSRSHGGSTKRFTTPEKVYWCINLENAWMEGPKARMTEKVLIKCSFCIWSQAPQEWPHWPDPLVFLSLSPALALLLFLYSDHHQQKHPQCDPGAAQGLSSYKSVFPFVCFIKVLGHASKLWVPLKHLETIVMKLNWTWTCNIFSL